MTEIPGEVLREWADGWRADRDRLAMLETAVRVHRAAVARVGPRVEDYALWRLVPGTGTVVVDDDE